MIDPTQSIWKRRDFLKTASAATAALLAGGAPQVLRASESQEIEPTADAVIVLWMAGGMASTDTFDPKTYVPYEQGMDAGPVLSTFPAIDTVVDNIKFTEGLENIAGVMDRGTLIRTQVGADLGFILHSRHQYHWHTGYEPPLTVAAPHIGAWIANILGPKDPAVPAFIDIGQPYEGNGEAEELKAFQTAGFLGSEFGPFRVPHADQAISAVRPPAGMSQERFRRRWQAYRDLVEASPLAGDMSEFQRESLERSLENANRLLDSPAAAAFDLSLEPQEVYDRYNTGKFGQGCLLARRLVEAGARFVEVTTEYVPFLGWDTHDNGHTRLVDMKRQIDAPIAQLVLDLEERGLLDRTLIVLASEFSRDMLVEGKPDQPVQDQIAQPDILNEMKHYGMHRHFTSAGSVLLFGGGAQQGLLYGKTADERPLHDDRKPGDDYRPARHDLPGAGHSRRLQTLHRAEAVLRDQRWFGRADSGTATRVKSPPPAFLVLQLHDSLSRGPILDLAILTREAGELVPSAFTMFQPGLPMKTSRSLIAVGLLVAIFSLALLDHSSQGEDPLAEPAAEAHESEATGPAACPLEQLPEPGTMVVDAERGDVILSAVVQHPENKPCIDDWGQRIQAFVGCSTADGGEAKMIGYFVFLVDVPTETVFDGLMEIGARPRVHYSMQEGHERSGLSAETTADDYLQGDPAVLSVIWEGEDGWIERPYQDFAEEKVEVDGEEIVKPWTPSFVFHGSGAIHHSGTGCIACPCDCAGGIIADNRFPLYDPKPTVRFDWSQAPPVGTQVYVRIRPICSSG